jgi:hypothetical protein
MQYNLHHKPKHWLCSLAWEAESAISQLPEHEQDYDRYRITHAIDTLYKRQEGTQPTLKKQHLHEKKLVQQIKNKLATHKSMITKADKGNALVIIYQQEYDKKAEDFINSDHFSTLNKDPTQMFQKEIWKAITHCTTTISKKQ